LSRLLIITSEYKETSVFTAEGTAAHELSEHKLRTFLRQKSIRPTSEFDSDELDYYTDVYVDYAIELITQARQNCRDPIILLEQRLDYFCYVAEGFGTGDLVVIADDILDIVDLKYGKGCYLFDVPTKQFALRPDIVINVNGRIIILDTKWKLLDNIPKYNYGISQADMYQMYAYAKKYNTEEVLLLYPKSQLMKELNAEIRYESNDGVNVKIFFVDLNNIEDSMKRLKEQMNIG
jgi:hypothetical protein